MFIVNGLDLLRLREKKRQTQLIVGVHHMYLIATVLSLKTKPQRANCTELYKIMRKVKSTNGALH